MTDLQPDWRQRKKAAARERIWGSALRLFREQGYDATTVEQIAAAAGELTYKSRRSRWAWPTSTTCPSRAGRVYGRAGHDLRGE
jgi:hypothetical protein